MPATQLKTLPPSRSPERAALAEAIERRDTAAQMLTRLKTALEQSETSLYGDMGLLSALDRAELALSEAQANESRHLAAAALGEATDDTNPVKVAERVLTEAQAKLDLARKTRDALTTEINDAAQELDRAKEKIDDAVRNVMHEEAGDIIDRTLRECRALQEQLGAKRLVLSFLRDACFETWPPSSATKPIENFLSARAYPLEDGRSPSHPALAPWRNTQEALATDADAALPV